MMNASSTVDLWVSWTYTVMFLNCQNTQITLGTYTGLLSNIRGIPAWLRFLLLLHEKSESGFSNIWDIKFSEGRTCWTHKRQSCDYRGKTGWLSDEGRQYQSRPIWGHQHEIWFHKTNAVSFLMCLTFTVNEKVLIALWHFFIIWFQKV